FAGASASPQRLTLRQADFHQRRIDRAHRRFLATLRTLAAVRRLAVPALQVSIARERVNAAGVPALPSPSGSGARERSS
ncbi:MAG TPA: hypothetical protein VGK85_02270, partial [Myxococcaceae bacterium]